MTEQVNIPCFSVSQPVGTFYSGVLSARELLNICRFDYRRMHFSGGYIDYLGIQRKLKDSRVKSIAKYVTTLDASFPTAIVLSVDERCAQISSTSISGLFNLTVRPYVDEISPELSIPLDHSTTIIDGQHRLKGLQIAERLDFELSVSVFVGADDATEAQLFSIVNLAQTKVNKSLVYDLFSLAESRSPEKTCHEIVVALDKISDSPFFGRIKRLGVATEGRFGETLSQATVVKGILPYISDDPLFDRDRGKRLGFWDPIFEEGKPKRIFYEFFRQRQDEKILANIFNYFSAIRQRWPRAWASTGQGNIINRTNGFNGFCRFMRQAYLYNTTTPKIIGQEQYFDIFSRCKLNDEDFNSLNFVPGTSGSTKLYHTLVDQTNVDSVR